MTLSNSITKIINKHKGLFFGLIFAILAPFNGVFLKNLTRFSANYVCAYRSLFQLLWVWPVIIYQNKKYKDDFWNRIYYDFWPVPYSWSMLFKLNLKGASGTIGNTILFAAFNYLPIADCTCFNFASGMVTACLAWWILNDKIDLLSGLGLIATFIGCIFIAQPTVILSYFGINFSSKDEISVLETNAYVYMEGNNSYNSSLLIQEEKNLKIHNLSTENIKNDKDILIGVMMGFCVTCLFGITNFCSRLISKDIHWTITLIYYSLLTVIVLWPYTYFFEDHNGPFTPNLKEVLYLNLIGLNGTITQLLMILAYIYEKPYKVVLITSTTILFAFIYDYLFYGISGNFWSIGGAGLILLAVFGEFWIRKFFGKNESESEENMLEK